MGVGCSFICVVNDRVASNDGAYIFVRVLKKYDLFCHACLI